jgi:hypothetical protein
MRRHLAAPRLVALILAAVAAHTYLQSASAQTVQPSDNHVLGASDVSYEWRYSCPAGKACSFTCPGSGGASNVKTLTLQLGTIPVSGDQKAFGTFYKFSTAQIPRANGFSLTTGISSLSCQVNGMELDYAGTQRSRDDDPPTATVPSQKRP